MSAIVVVTFKDKGLRRGRLVRAVVVIRRESESSEKAPAEEPRGSFASHRPRTKLTTVPTAGHMSGALA